MAAGEPQVKEGCCNIYLRTCAYHHKPIHDSVMSTTNIYTQYYANMWQMSQPRPRSFGCSLENQQKRFLRAQWDLQCTAFHYVSIFFHIYPHLGWFWIFWISKYIHIFPAYLHISPISTNEKPNKTAVGHGGHLAVRPSRCINVPIFWKAAEIASKTWSDHGSQLLLVHTNINMYNCIYVK